MRHAHSLALACVSFITFAMVSSCKTRKYQETPSEPTDSRSTETINLRGLLKENSKASREKLASHIEMTMKAMKGTTPGRSETMMLSQMKVTAQALRAGAHSICEDSERIRFFRGTSGADSTTDGKFIVTAKGLQKQGDLGQLMKHAARAVKNPSVFDVEQTDPLNFEELTSRHTASIDLGSSLFISTTAISRMADGFGTKRLEILACPTRFPSTSSHAWAEGEFLPFLAILPEEIVSEAPVSSPPTIKFNLLAQCYAPEVGRGPKTISITISTENFQAYNDALVQRAESSSSDKWNSFLTSHLKTACNCEEMVKRKNELYKNSLPPGARKFDLFPAANECEDHISREIP